MASAGRAMGDGAQQFNSDDDFEYLCIGAVSPNTTKAVPVLSVSQKASESLEDFSITDGSDFVATSFCTI
ncbi:hypothetical protein Nmel_007697 [Mimus melanotis]